VRAARYKPLYTSDRRTGDKMTITAMVPGVDWITVTQKQSDEFVLWSAAKKIVAECDLQYKGQSNRHGFKGEFYVANSGGSFYYGERFSPRPGWGMATLTGAMARDYWAWLMVRESRVTRYDLRVDCEMVVPDPDLAKICYNELQSYKVSHNKRQPKASLYIGEGDTLYVGSRSSNGFGRLYDKGMESGSAPKGKLWRYEVELKQEYAEQASANLFNLILRDEPDLFIKTIARTVADWFSDRYVVPIFTMSDAKVTRIEFTSVNRRGDTLKWLRQSVRPSVARLIEKGWVDEVYKALGLKPEEFTNDCQDKLS
jgi:hypothetical protein